MEEEMTNLEKYVNAFVTTFGVSTNDVESLTYQSVTEWDSVGHMELIAVLEDAFGITMDTDDIIDFSSFEKGKEILKKYDVEVS
jgi:acyl carrier protein